MPLSKVEKIRATQIETDKKHKKQFLDGTIYSYYLQCNQKEIPALRKKIRKIMASNMVGRNSYWYSDSVLNKLAMDASDNFLKTIFFSFLLLVLFASCINAYSAIKINLQNRKREFALLRSIGADKDTIKNIFKKEARYFILNPLLKAFPFGLVIMAIPILRFDIIFLSDFLKTFDWFFFVFFTLALALTIKLLYRSKTNFHIEWQ